MPSEMETLRRIWLGEGVLERNSKWREKVVQES